MSAFPSPLGVFWWFSRLRILPCPCYGTGLSPGLGTSTSQGRGQKKKKKKKSFLFSVEWCSIVYTTLCSFIHLWMNIWVPSTFLALWTTRLWTWVYKHLFKTLLSLVLDVQLTIEQHWFKLCRSPYIDFFQYVPIFSFYRSLNYLTVGKSLCLVRDHNMCNQKN